MDNDRNEADRILGEDWMMPGYRRFLEAWAKHPQRELLDERKGEIGRDGSGTVGRRPRAPRGRLGRVLATPDRSARRAREHLHRPFRCEITSSGGLSR